MIIAEVFNKRQCEQTPDLGYRTVVSTVGYFGVGVVVFGIEGPVEATVLIGYNGVGTGAELDRNGELGGVAEGSVELFGVKTHTVCVSKSCNAYVLGFESKRTACG